MGGGAASLILALALAGLGCAPPLHWSLRGSALHAPGSPWVEVNLTVRGLAAYAPGGGRVPLQVLASRAPTPCSAIAAHLASTPEPVMLPGSLTTVCLVGSSAILCLDPATLLPITAYANASSVLCLERGLPSRSPMVVVAAALRGGSLLLVAVRGAVAVTPVVGGLRFEGRGSLLIYPPRGAAIAAYSRGHPAPLHWLEWLPVPAAQVDVNGSLLLLIQPEPVRVTILTHASPAVVPSSLRCTESTAANSASGTVAPAWLLGLAVAAAVAAAVGVLVVARKRSGGEGELL